MAIVLTGMGGGFNIWVYQEVGDIRAGGGDNKARMKVVSGLGAGWVVSGLGAGW